MGGPAGACLAAATTASATRGAYHSMRLFLTWGMWMSNVMACAAAASTAQARTARGWLLRQVAA